MQQLGKNLRAYRKERRLTQTELAHLVGVAPAYVSQIESALRMPSLKVARRFAEALKIELPVLLGTSDPEAGERLSDAEKLEMLRTVARSIERDLETRSSCELSEQYEGSDGHVVTRWQGREVRVYRFRAQATSVGREALFVHDADEVVYCAAGRLLVRLGDEEHVLEAGETCRIEPSVPHRVRGDEGSVCVSTVDPVFSERELRRVPSGEPESSAGRPVR